MNAKIICIALFAIVLSVVLPEPVQAKFERSEKNLYQGYLDLQVEEDNRSEFYAYAITQGCKTCSVVYLLVQNFKGEDRAWTSFRCDVEFVVMTTSHNGLYDIRCTSRRFDGTEFTHVYAYDGNDYVRN